MFEYSTYVSSLHLVDEVRVEEQVLQVLVLIESFLNVAQELRSDDATTSPHQGDTSVVQVPAEFVGLSLSTIKLVPRYKPDPPSKSDVHATNFFL